MFCTRVFENLHQQLKIRGIKPAIGVLEMDAAHGSDIHALQKTLLITSEVALRSTKGSGLSCVRWSAPARDGIFGNY
ncbi:MAG: hypothetical protein AB9880_07735 [Christensenellales bacterium]